MYKKQIIASLILIASISILMKLYLIDFSTYVTGDVMGYALSVFSFSNGDFTPTFHKTPGWPYFIFPFFQLIDSNNFIDYSVIIKSLSIAVSTLTIIPVYYLAKKWFSEKYSIVGAALFAFEPHLNYNAGLGYAEPLYIALIVITLYFISSTQYRYVCLSFLFVGLAWWTRWPGALIFLVISIIFLFNSRKSKHSVLKYLGCVGIFLIVVSPMLIDRNNTFGDPLYFESTSALYTGDYAPVQSNMVNTTNLEYSAFDYIDDNGLQKFIERFLIDGSFSITADIIKNSFPYLIFLIPFGILLSFKALTIDRKLISANWLVILVTIISLVTAYAVINEKRFLFPIIPFLILFAVLPIQRLIENGFSTFAFSEHQKNLALIILLMIILLSSFWFIQRYDIFDQVEAKEKLDFAEHALTNFEGKMLDAGGTTSGIRYLKLQDPEGAFKTYLNSNHKYPKETILKEGYLVPFKSNDDLILIALYAKTFDEFMTVSKDYGLDYISISDKHLAEPIYPYFKNLYNNELQYAELKKVFDSNDHGYEKFRVKVFKIVHEE